jgi:hypothetical protein
VPDERPPHHNPNEKRTEAELHYRELMAFFKNLVWLTGGALAVLLTVAGWLGVKSLRQVSEEAKASVEATKESATNEIDKIREQSGRLAIDEARLRIESAFKDTNISAMIQIAAERQVNEAVQRDIQQSVDQAAMRIQDEIDTLGRISDAGAKIRINMASGIQDMRALMKSTTNTAALEMATNIMRSIGSDYERSLLFRLYGDDTNSTSDLARRLGLDPTNTRP